MPAICPWCNSAIREIAFRTFGPAGNVVITCHKDCMKPISVNILPPPAPDPKANPLVIPKH